MGHIIERFLIHVASSATISLCFFFALRFWLRKSKRVGAWVSSNKQHLLVISALLVFAFLPIREAYDVAFGNQVWYKTPFDQLSWFLGPLVSTVLLYRFDKLED